MTTEFIEMLNTQARQLQESAKIQSRNAHDIAMKFEKMGHDDLADLWDDIGDMETDIEITISKIVKKTAEL